MREQEKATHFIGRTEEIDIFKQWLADTHAPHILYIHDAAEDPDKKGGVGKTWLLHKYVEIAKQTGENIALVQADFFNIGNRDRIFLAEKIVAGLQELYPEWSPVSFTAITNLYRARARENEAATPTTSSASIEIRIREEVAAALAEDLQRLDTYPVDTHKTLLVLLDTFEAIEQNTSIAVLRQSQHFPDNYQYKGMRFVIAGRNKIDWTQLNWKGREHEVRVLALDPFNQQEMLELVEAESFYEIPRHSDLASALYERTEGRPIIIGLTIDVLNHRVVTLADLVSVSRAEFEGYLVPQINKLENPLNWVILFMAHVYHRFNISILEWILQNVPISKPVRSITREELAARLPTLSFIRQSGSGDDFVLHDEMRRLVNKYCWEVLDTDGRTRKDISRSVIRYYEQEMGYPLSESHRQGYIIETLYHRLYLDLDDGLLYFEQQFLESVRLLKNAFARLLLQQVQAFADVLSPAQRDELSYSESVLLRSEESPVAALRILQRLEYSADPQWYANRLSSILIEKGRCYVQQSRLSEARDSFLKALEIEQAEGRDIQSAQLLSNLGGISRRTGQFSTALDYYEQSIAIYKRLGRQRDYASALTNISTIYRLQGKTDEALRRCKVAWIIRQELFREGTISEVQVGLSLNALGNIFLSAGNVLEAEKRFHDAYDIFLRVNYKAGIAIIYNRFGQVQLLKGELESARHWFVRGQEASREIEIEQYINSLNKQGRVRALQQQWVEAATFFEQAIASALKVSDSYQQTESLIDLADVLDRLRERESPARLLQQAEDIAVRENYVYLRGLVERARGEIEYRAGNYEVAFRHFVIYCQHMAHYNSIEFSAAIQRVVDALLGLPKEMGPKLVQQMITYWTTQQLDESYPDLILAFEEVNTLMTL